MVTRQNLLDLSDADRQKYHGLVVRYIAESDAIVEHANAFHDAHGINFLSWHRYFITKFEHWLHKEGADEFIPSPAWNPGDQIPIDFVQPTGTPSDELRDGDISQPLPGRFTLAGDGKKSLSDFASYSELNDDIEGYHDGVHNDIGGVMATENSPKDPVFWPFHSMLTMVYEQWLYR